MDNYQYSGVFEKLAIKIVEAKCGYTIDLEKSGVTQATRDYGVDAIISFSNRYPEFSTIEAKLRKSDYTLGMKDIASSILFFLVRNGNEHFIVSNVYITSGTIETISILNLQSSSHIYYIAGEETFDILTSIASQIKDPLEKELTDLLIENFKGNKKPKKKQIQTNVDNNLSFEQEKQGKKELFSSRRKHISEILNCMQEKYHVFILHGEKNIGKTFLLKQLNSTLQASEYKTITIDVYKYDTIDVFCYEIAQRILEIDLKKLIYSLSQNHIKTIENILDDSEKETLNIFNNIFHAISVSDTVANYLAEKYLKALFSKCNAIKFIIELEKVSYTSKEVFDFIKSFSIDLPSNVYLICEFSSDFSATYRDFSDEYKEIYACNIKEINLTGMSLDECEAYLKKALPHIENSCVKRIHNITKGNPVIIEQAISIINDNVLINMDELEIKILSLQKWIYNEIFMLIKNDALIAEFFLLLYIFSFSLKKTLWELVLAEKKECIQSISILNSNILNTNLFEDNDEFYTCKDFTFIHKLEEYFEKKINKKATENLQHTLVSACQSELPALAKIRLLFLADDSSIVDCFESTKDLWMYKSNPTWQKQALKLVCRFYFCKAKTEEELSQLLKAIHYYLQYLNIVSFMGNFENNLHKKVLIYKSSLQNECSTASGELLYDIAQTLADIYIYEYLLFSKTSSFEKEKELLTKCIEQEWFTYVCDLKKIKILRYQALSFKSNGERKKYNKILQNIYTMYKGNAYAQLIYWANQAAPFYVNCPQKALECLKKCNLDKFLKDYSKEIKLYLWVKNDLGIVSFYNGDLTRAEKISSDVLEKSMRLKYSENIARGHNLLGAIALSKNNITLAEEEFFKAFTNCIDVNEESFIHFTVNYIVVTEKNDKKLVRLVANYLRSNHKRLTRIFETQNLNTCRWFVTLYAFYHEIKQWNSSLSNEMKVLFSPWLTETSLSLLEKYYINKKLIVLF